VFERFIQRENTIFHTLNTFLEEDLDFVIVGGYAVSAYKHRFSIDADIVVSEKDCQKFEEILKKNNFKKTVSKELEHVYASKFIRYQLKDDLPVSIDIMIDGIGSRETAGSFSLHELQEASKEKKIQGSEKEIITLVPSREMLIVMKLHSGRLTDFRDIVALYKDVDIDVIGKYLWRGKKEVVKKHITTLLGLIDKKEFVDSFKGVFIEKKYDVDIESVKKLQRLLQ
jgi:hypothetical protein